MSVVSTRIKNTNKLRIKGSKAIRALGHAATYHYKQTRKYTGEAYITHPIAVAQIYSDNCTGEPDEDIVAACLLHDVVEDSDCTFTEIAFLFGHDVAQYVQQCTNPWPKKECNLRVMKRGALTVKACDMIHNLQDIVDLDPKWAKKYVSDKAKIAHHFISIEPKIYKLLINTIDNCERELAKWEAREVLNEK